MLTGHCKEITNYTINDTMAVLTSRSTYI